MKNALFIVLIATLSFSASCKKKKDAHVPPDLELKTGGSYVSGNATVNQGDSVLVGITIAKKEDDLKTFNISYAYDGAASATTWFNYVMSSAEYGGYDHDFRIHTRNQAGSEKWVFTVTDRDGNLSQKSITLTVQ